MVVEPDAHLVIRIDAQACGPDYWPRRCGWSDAARGDTSKRFNGLRSVVRIRKNTHTVPQRVFGIRRWGRARGPPASLSSCDS
jgi:hypothetical protein